MTTGPWRLLILSMGMAALLAGIAAAPARADDDWRHREWREHQRREHMAWCAHHPYACGRPTGYVYAAPPPPVVYAPAPTVYAPPPAVVYPPAGLNIVVPIHIR
ncbi:MAG TPA: hypothetical protein VE397_04505 [Stellaceae bacterium]|nr:hypothetical protein [Stellaceae bacterium]